MARPDRPTPDPLSPIEGLAERPWSFDYFEALRRIEAAWPQRPRLGRSARPVEDVVRITQRPSLEFPASALTKFTPPTGTDPGRVEQVFFGLFGPNAPLPLHLTEYAVERLRHGSDPTLAAFADIFHHRMASLLYRAWASSRPTVDADRPEEAGFRRYIRSLVGLGLEASRDHDAMPDEAKLFHAPRLASIQRNPEGLEAILCSYLGLRARIIEHVAEWIPLERGVQMCMAGPGKGSGAPQLGLNTMIGVASWSASHRFRIVIGPLEPGAFESLLPGGSRLEALAAIVESYIGKELAWEVRLVLTPAAVRPVELGARGRLGWDSWMAPNRNSPQMVDLRGIENQDRRRARQGAGTRHQSTPEIQSH